MAHNAITEDYQRLALRFVMSSDASHNEAMNSFATFWRSFSHDRDMLPQTDADRAFHLVALATNLVDYQYPFVPEDQADAVLVRGRELLDEALSLDPSCHDARRMRTCLDIPSFDERLAFLVQGKDDVQNACSEAAAAALADAPDERNELGSHLAMYPYLRWLAAMADHALVCGHNHSCLNYCRELLKLDPNDISDVRFTMALAYAKLEDEDGLAAMPSLLGPGRSAATLDDAWYLIARMALAYKACDLRKAQAALDDILSLYPMAEQSLVRQAELPDGLFARVHTAPYSEDELIVALSEATVLTQEGAEEYGQGPFGMWIVDEIVRRTKGRLGVFDQLSIQKRGGSQ